MPDLFGLLGNRAPPLSAKAALGPGGRQAL